MTSTEDATLINMICPYCKESFRKQVDYQKKQGLFTILIKNHSDNSDCPPFIAFIDNNGKHRGSQKIDDVETEEEISINDQLLEAARNRINELKDDIRFYHLKVPRRGGRGFEHKVASVSDRSFMSSKFYQSLIDFLTVYEEDNTFGAISIESDTIFEGGLLVYGKYLGMIYTMFWKEQKSLFSKSLDDLKAEANLTVEKLIELYDIMDLFF
ncbi:MAG: hypothetical protein CEE43_03570 [Promethearchaeota archaeon Loki_b32]|nr:MAG: hypothetical protein CEE43_03570 [Candidatus Lokiarchaeota archaeon Loki_b32]